MRRALLTALAVASGIVLLFVTWLYASLSGGLDDAFRPKKTAGSKDVREARKRAGPVLAREAAALGLRLGEPREECATGQHNWKLDDDYDVSCELTGTAPVGTDRRALLALHDRLAASGWVADTGLDVPAALASGVDAAYYERGDRLRLEVEWRTSGTAAVRYRFFHG